MKKKQTKKLAKRILKYCEMDPHPHEGKWKTDIDYLALKIAPLAAKILEKE